MNETDFIKQFVQNAPFLMWFLGAGTSRSSGLRTAADIVWDLKRRHYCLKENQDFQTHDVNNRAIKRKIQEYMDSQGFPSLSDKGEYGFYFKLCFGTDLAEQQKYINAILATSNISPTVGPRVLAALLKLGQSRIIFTTNFDEVIESTLALVAGDSINPYHFEGSYAALDALNSEQFPLYIKLHGDFRYQSIANLPRQLEANDKELQRCFLAASNRYGLVVSGYSGRDENVMSMLREAIEQNNAFPRGLFWTTPKKSELLPQVVEMIELAKSKKIASFIVETGTFDELMLKVWKQIPNKPAELNEKVLSSFSKSVSISLPSHGTEYPVLRTNALPVFQVPRKCGVVVGSESIDLHNLKDQIFRNRPNAVIAFKDRVLFWGEEGDLAKVLPEQSLGILEDYEIEDPLSLVSNSTVMQAFYEEALATALCSGKPLVLRRDSDRSYFAVVKHDQSGNPLLRPLREAVGFKGSLGAIAGNIPRQDGLIWAEAVSIRLERRNKVLWLLLRPDIWVSPLSKRYEATDFLRKQRLHRYNGPSYRLLDSWITILLGTVGGGGVSRPSCFSNARFHIEFEVGTRTAYSRRGGKNAQ